MVNFFYLFVVLVISSATGMFILAYQAWQRRSTTGALTLAFLLFAISWWGYTNGIEHLWPSLAGKTSLARAEYLGVVMIPPLLLAFVLQYTRREHWLQWKFVVPALIIPVASLIAVWTNPWHHLFDRYASLVWHYGYPVMRVLHGPLFWVHTAYSYLLLLIAVVLLAESLHHTSGPFRRQQWTLLLAALLPWLANLLSISGLNPLPLLDLTPLAFAATGIGIYVAVFQLHLLDIVPIALRTAVENMADGMLVLNREGRILDMNPVAERLLEKPAGQVIGRPLADMISLTAARCVVDNPCGQMAVEFEMFVQGQPRFVEAGSSAIRDSRGQEIGRVVVLRDVTERKQIEQAERDQRRLAEAFRDTAAILNSTIQLDTVLTLVLANIERVVPHDAACVALFDENGAVKWSRFRGYTPEERKPVLDLCCWVAETAGWRDHLEHPTPLILPDATQDPTWAGRMSVTRLRAFLNVPVRFKDRVIGLINLASAAPGFFTPIHGGRLQVFADQAAIAIENARLYAEVQHLTLLDELTHIYNYRGLVELGQRELDRARRFNRPLSVLFFDVDHFRDFNNRYTHAVGNVVLQTVAKAAKECLRAVDLIARYGGEEFVVLLPETSLESAQSAAEHLCKVVAETAVSTNYGKLNITVSIGAAELTEEVSSLGSLIEKANQAEQRAKADGRNRVSTAPLPNGLPARLDDTWPV